MTSGSELREDWHDWRYDGRGWYLLNDPEITFGSEEEAMAYCDEHNRALVGQAAINERNKIAAWLRALDSDSGDINRFLPSTLAQWIEEGAHTL